PDEMSEFEIKLGVPLEAVASLSAALRAGGARSLRLQARYFDTADARLARQQVALRLRLEGRRWMQTLKAAGDSAVDRLEHEVTVRPSSSGLPVIDLRRHDGNEAAAVLNQALHGASDAALSERCATDVRRLRCVMRGAGGAELEVALDQGSASAGERSAP